MAYSFQGQGSGQRSIHIPIHNHRTLTVQTALNAISQVGPTARQRIRSATSAKKLAIGGLSAEVEDHHPEHRAHREVNREPIEGHTNGTLDRRGLMLLTSQTVTAHQTRSVSMESSS